MLTLHLRPSDPITIRHAGEEMVIILDERKPDGRTRLVKRAEAAGADPLQQRDVPAAPVREPSTLYLTAVIAEPLARWTSTITSELRGTP